MPATTMSFWMSFSDILYFTRNARKAPLIPEGFVLETPPDCKSTAIQLQPESPTFCSSLPTISQSPISSPPSPIPETPVILMGNNSTDTLVNIVSKSGSPTPILQLHPPADKAVQMRRISFADCPTPSRPVEPANAIDVGQVPPKPFVTIAAETHEQAKPFRENVPITEKKSKRKSILRSMSLLVPRTSGTKAHRFSVPAFSSVTDDMSKRASNQL